MIRIEAQIAEAIGNTDKRPVALRSLPYSEIESAQSQRCYRLLYALGRDLRPRVYVELGVLHGWGLAHMKTANPDALIVGVDLTFDVLAIPRTGLRLIDGDSITAVWVMKFLDRSVDMIMFDSDHHSEHLLAEFNAWDPMCRSGCIQLFDDIAAPEARDAWDALPGPKYEVHELHPETGFGLRIKP